MVYIFFNYVFLDSELNEQASVLEMKSIFFLLTLF